MALALVCVCWMEALDRHYPMLLSSNLGEFDLHPSTLDQSELVIPPLATSF